MMEFDFEAFSSGAGIVVLGYLCGFVVHAVVAAFSSSDKL